MGVLEWKQGDICILLTINRLRLVAARPLRRFWTVELNFCHGEGGFLGAFSLGRRGMAGARPEESWRNSSLS